jgi:glycoprotein 6-alpha-L-fucosyltransferase
MTLNDGYEAWRDQEFQDLSNLVQQRFEIHQNPSDCENAKLLTNVEEKPCGWGCQFILYMDDFHASLVLNRSLVFKKPPLFFYEPDEHQKFCKPITETCNFTFTEKEVVKYPGKNDTRIIRTDPYIRLYARPNKLLPTNLPTQLFPRLDKLLEEPDVWWIGQILKFVTRLRPHYQKLVRETAAKIGIESPIVGVHIRRGNKVKEIAPASVTSYMAYVKEFYEVIQLSRRIDKKRVFIVTDEPSVIDELEQKYPDYEFLFNHDFSNNVSHYQSQNTSAWPIYIDTQLMAMCDCFVGTFSSNLGRRFYAANYWLHKDANTFSKSIDYRYYENSDNPVFYQAIIEHTDPNSNATMSVGDFGILRSLYYDTSGLFSLELNKTGKTINVPKFKLEKIFDTIHIGVFD